MGQDCKYCGAYISSGLDACPSCGKKVKAEKPDPAESYTAPAEPEVKSYARPDYRSYSTGAAAAAAFAEDQKARQEQQTQQREQRGREERKSSSTGAAYTYKQEYERRYGDQAQYSANRSAVFTTDEEEDAAKNKGMAYLCYLGPLFLIPYLTRKDSDFIRFHSNQGLLLWLVEMISSILLSGSALGGILDIICFVYFIKGLIAVSRGEKKKLPLIGELQLLK